MIKKVLAIYKKAGFYPLFLRAISYLVSKIPSKLTKKITAKLIRKSKVYCKGKIVNSFQSEPKYLNIGGARFIREDWRVLDHVSPLYKYKSIFIDYDVDLEALTKWPIRDASYDLAYTSHTLEHLSDEAVRHTFKEVYRILKPGGGFRICVPDMDVVVEHYQKRDLQWFLENRNCWLNLAKNTPPLLIC